MPVQKYVAILAAAAAAAPTHFWRAWLPCPERTHLARRGLRVILGGPAHSFAAGLPFLAVWALILLLRASAHVIAKPGQRLVLSGVLLPGEHDTPNPVGR